MAIGLHTEGTWAAATATTQTLTLPTHSTGDMLILRVGMKHATLPGDITVDTAGWTQIDEHNNGTTASGNGVGDVEIAAFYREAASASETDPVVRFHASVAATPSCGVATSFSKGAGEAWVTPVGDSGSIAAATNYSATMASHISATANDWLVGYAVTNDNTTLTVPTITQTGLTLAAVVESPAAALSSATSNDISADGCYRVVNSGTSSAAAVFSGTNSVADVGAAMVIRLRVAAADTGDAEVATGTGAASNTSASIATDLEVATATGAALDASVQTGKAVTAEVATATGEASNVTGTVVASLGVATGTGAAEATGPNVGATAQVGTATGEALDATTTAGAPATSANAEVATAAGAAQTVSASIAVNTQLPTATGAALDATATASGESISTSAEVATAVGEAYDSTFSVAGAAGGGKSGRPSNKRRRPLRVQPQPRPIRDPEDWVVLIT
jgi:hypothetical protein